IYKRLAEFISQKIRDENDICLGQFESEELLDEILKRVIPVIYNVAIDDAIKSVRNVGDRLEEELDMRKVV
ncbi:DUF2164 family protein, partial [Escherichia coli]|uniref:DUF2164 family protein n=1 Tax=Escherichia coli TaxID=562 RepID=UPI001939E9BA